MGAGAWARPVLLLVLALPPGLVPQSPASAEGDPAEKPRTFLGLSVEVRAEGVADVGAGRSAAFGALARVEATLSAARTSELSRLNDHGRDCVSAELVQALVLALDVSRAASGAFDPTAEPLARASRHEGGRWHIPDAADRRRLLKRVGVHRVAVDPVSGCVQLAAGTRIDLSGVVRGYAADRALFALQERGARSAVVALGGTRLAILGEASVDVPDPERSARPAWASFAVEGGGVAITTGDDRLAPLLDARNGLPVSGVLAVAVVARTAAEADVLSTAIFVLGTSRGLDLLERWGAEGLLLTREGGRPTVFTTPGFAKNHALRPRTDVQVLE